MRKVEFHVNPEVILEFTEELTDRELTNSLIGITDDGEIIIEVQYEKAEQEEIDELENVLEELNEGLEVEEEED
jgi:hypothetical protein